MNVTINNFIKEKVRKYKQILFLIIILVVSYFIGRTVATNKFTSFHLMSFIILFLLVVSRFKIQNLLVIYLFIFPFNYWTSIGQVNLNLNELLILVLFFLWFFGLFLKGKIKYKTNPFNKWILAYVLLSLVLLVNSPLSNKSTYKAIARTMEFGMFFLVLANNFPTNNDKKYLKRLSNLLLFAMMIVCSIGIIEFLVYNRNFPQSFINFHQRMISLGMYPPRPLQKIVNLSMGGKTIGSTFASRFALSIYLSAILPLVFIKILFVKDLFRKVVFIFMFALGLLSLFLTGSRTGSMAFLAGIIVIFYVLKTKKLFSFAAIVILGILIFSYFLPQSLQKRLTFRSYESSLIGRKIYAKRSIEIIKNNVLIGAGIDSLGAEEGKSKPHNAFLTEFQIKGIFGFLIITGLFLSAIKCSYKNLTLLIKDKNIGPYALWVFVVIVIYFITSFAAEPFYENQTSMLFILVVAISSTFLKKKFKT